MSSRSSQKWICGNSVTWTYDICDAHWASSFYIKTSRQNSVILYIYNINLYIWLNISSCYCSIPLALGLIGRDGGLGTLCHSCGFACQQRVLKTFPGPGYLLSEDGVVWLRHSLVYLYILYIYIIYYIYVLYIIYMYYLYYIYVLHIIYLHVYIYIYIYYILYIFWTAEEGNS